MIPYDGPERRKYERKRAHFITSYKITQPPEVIMNMGKRNIESVMLDLSEGGMALITKYVVPVETVLRLEWTLINPYAENDDRIRRFVLDGQVRTCAKLEEDEYRLGVTFLDLQEGDRKAIAGFIAYNRRA